MEIALLVVINAVFVAPGIWMFFDVISSFWRPGVMRGRSEPLLYGMGLFLILIILVVHLSDITGSFIGERY